MKNLGFDWHFISRKLLMALCFWFFDSLFIVLGTGLCVQTTLVLLYRWSLYTPGQYDLRLLFFLGLMFDVVFVIPLGFHSFLYVLMYIFIQSQSRYLRTSHQYIRWFIFFGVVVLFNQSEYLLRIMLGQGMTIRFSMLTSILVTFALYPTIFRILQRYD